MNLTQPNLCAEGKRLRELFREYKPVLAPGANANTRVYQPAPIIKVYFQHKARCRFCNRRWEAK